MAALAVYAVVVGGPLLLLFFRAAASGGLAGAPAFAGSTDAPPIAAVSELPPFDAYAADEAPPFPDLDLRAVDGGSSLDFSEAVSGPAIVHLWSLACESCAAEWQSFERLMRESVALGLPPIVSVLVLPEADADLPAAARRRLEGVRREGWFGRPASTVSAPWVVPEDRVLADGERPTADRPITGYPETFLLDGRRRIRLRFAGPMPWDAETWRRVLEAVPDLS